MSWYNKFWYPACLQTNISTCFRCKLYTLPAPNSTFEAQIRTGKDKKKGGVYEYR